MGINKPIGLPIKGEGNPKIPYPNDTDWDGLDFHGWPMDTELL